MVSGGLEQRVCDSLFWDPVFQSPAGILPAPRSLGLQTIMSEIVPARVEALVGSWYYAAYWEEAIRNVIGDMAENFEANGAGAVPDLITLKAITVKIRTI